MLKWYWPPPTELPTSSRKACAPAPASHWNVTDVPVSIEPGTGEKISPLPTVIPPSAVNALFDV